MKLKENNGNRFLETFHPNFGLELQQKEKWISSELYNKSKYNFLQHKNTHNTYNMNRKPEKEHMYYWQANIINNSTKKKPSTYIHLTEYHMSLTSIALKMFFV